MNINVSNRIKIVSLYGSFLDVTNRQCLEHLWENTAPEIDCYLNAFKVTLQKGTIQNGVQRNVVNIRVSA